MKKMIFFAVSLLLTCSANFVHDMVGNSFRDDEDFVSCPKKYIQFDQIGVSDHGIYVSIGEYVIKTSAIHSDGYGLYFDDFKSVDDVWICNECKVINKVVANLCINCASVNPGL
jgi:hypothetical protein